MVWPAFAVRAKKEALPERVSAFFFTMRFQASEDAHFDTVAAVVAR